MPAWIGIVGLVASCGSPATETAAGSQARIEPELDAAGKPVGLEHYRKWSDRLCQGGQPEGDVAFRNLAAFGVKTVISVDGARPDVEAASRYGLRYVHVPFGYDGVPHDSQVRIVQAVRASEGLVYVHCHHGVHRGPAGAMFARIALDGISREQAVLELKQSGCDDKYKGLFRDVLHAVAPSEDELSALPPVLPSYVSPGDFVEQMASLSRTWERVGLVKSASWKTPADHPDVDPPHEARILWEKLRELQRLDEVKGHGLEFLSILESSEKSGLSLEESLRKGDLEGAAKAFGDLKKGCDSCHAKWRNN